MAENPAQNTENAEVGHIWSLPLRYIRRSVYADQVCASFIEEWNQRDRLREYMSHTSLQGSQRDANFYRNLVLGYCIRLHFIPEHSATEQRAVLRSLVSSLYAARAADERVRAALADMAKSAHWNTKWSPSVAFWHRERTRWLARTAWAVRKNVSPEVWDELRRYARTS